MSSKVGQQFVQKVPKGAFKSFERIQLHFPVIQESCDWFWWVRGWQFWSHHRFLMHLFRRFKVSNEKTRSTFFTGGVFSISEKKKNEQNQSSLSQMLATHTDTALIWNNWQASRDHLAHLNFGYTLFNKSQFSSSIIYNAPLRTRFGEGGEFA